MWLKLEIEGMKIELQIEGYQASDRENWDCQWCEVDFSFEFPDCINYSNRNAEILLSCEIDSLETKLDDFINNRIKKKESIDFIEPDFEFEFQPSYNVLETGECIYAAPGYETTTALVEWKIYLWNKGLTCNYFSTSLYVYEAKILRDYLKLITGKLKKDSIEIQEYIKKGFIGGQF